VEPPKTCQLAVASLVCGILGFVTLGVAGIPGIILGHAGMSRINRSSGLLGGGKIAVSGLVLSYIGLGLLGSCIGAVLSLKANAERAKIRQVRAEIGSYEVAIAMYKNSAGFFPTTEQGLKALVETPLLPPEPKRWVQIMKSLPSDPWNSPYAYHFPGRKLADEFEIISKGPDGVEATADDLSSLDVVK
jgi:general secretion pathway protein G